MATANGESGTTDPGAIINGGRRQALSCRPLLQPSDRLVLSEQNCLVRSLIEVFVVLDEDDPTGSGGILDERRGGGGGGGPRVGRIGMRCVHCAAAVASAKAAAAAGRKKGDDNGGGAGKDKVKDEVAPPPGRAKARGCVSYPASTRLVYQSSRNFQRYHIAACPRLPDAVRERYASLKGLRLRSTKASPRYWEESCKRLGMVDAPDDDGGGIRLIEGRMGFPSDDELVERNFSAVGRTGGATVAPAAGIADSSVGADCEGGHGPDSGTTPESLKRILSKTDRPDLQESQAESELVSDQGNGCAAPESSLNSALLSLDFGQECSVPNPAQLNHTWPAVDPERTPSVPSNELLLSRVQLAQFVIREMRQMCPVLPTPPRESDDPNSGALLGQQQEDDMHCLGAELYESLREEDDLPYLGEELYELFSGQPLLPAVGSSHGGTTTDDDDAAAADEAACHDDPHLRPGGRLLRRQKKEKRRVDERGYTTLGEMGFPASICSLVSSLLDSSSASNQEQQAYSSFGEVEDDLRILSENPESYLFRSVTGELQTTRHNLYGREKEVSVLLDACNRATDANSLTTSLVVVTGSSGTGKSTLIEHVRQSGFAEKGFCFASGKFDAMMQIQPLSAITSALDCYCDLLARDTDRIGTVRESVSAAFGNEAGRVLGSLVPLIPGLGKIVHVEDDQTNLPSGGDALQRLMHLFRTFLRATCKHERLVLCLDDLQWADEVSLELMKALVLDSDIRGLLVIGCYRDNEVGEDHPLNLRLREIRRSGRVHVASVHIDNLGSRGINALVSDVLGLAPGVTRSLSEVVLQKTGGNALFVEQLLSSLRDENLLRFSAVSRRWEWDMATICKQKVSDSVAGLMVAKLARLAPEVRHAVKVAAAFGVQCQELLLTILDRDPSRLVDTWGAALDVAASEGLMVLSGSVYTFSHDQIQEASYALIPASERDLFHLNIGRSLREFSSEEEMEALRFVVVDQMMRGSNLITRHDERLALAELSLASGQTASKMSAALPALSFLKAGTKFLTDGDWIDHRELCFDLYNLCAETEHMLGDFDGVAQHVEELNKRARTLQEHLRPNFTLIQSLGSQGSAIDAINAAFETLARLGEMFPADVSREMILQEIMATRQLICSKTEEELLELNPMADSEKKEAMRFLVPLLYYTYMERREYFPLVVCRTVRLTLSHGTCRESACAFMGCGILLCDPVGDYAGGYRLAKVALSLFEKFHAFEYLPLVHSGAYTFIFPWTEPIQATLPLLKRAFEVGVTNGEKDMVTWGLAHHYGGSALCAGRALGPLVEEMAQYKTQMLEYQRHYTCRLNRPIRQFAQSLLGGDSTVYDDGNLFDDSVAEDGITAGYSNKILRNFYRMRYLFLFGQYQSAWDAAKETTPIEEHAPCRFPVVCDHAFYLCLSALALAREHNREEYRDFIDQSMAKMKVWSLSSPWNCQHKLELMNAEHAYFEGDVDTAKKKYNAAIHLAGKHSFIHEEALALERAGIFYLGTGENSTASEYFTKAHDCYRRWGAGAKAAHIQSQYM